MLWSAHKCSTRLSWSCVWTCRFSIVRHAVGIYLSCLHCVLAWHDTHWRCTESSLKCLSHSQWLCCSRWRNKLWSVIGQVAQQGHEKSQSAFEVQGKLSQHPFLLTLDMLHGGSLVPLRTLDCHHKCGPLLALIKVVVNPKCKGEVTYKKVYPSIEN